MSSSAVVTVVSLLSISRPTISSAAFTTGPLVVLSVSLVVIVGEFCVPCWNAAWAAVGFRRGQSRRK
ncbi:hypothetical protein PF005_g23383 [Phytophthora fragariae]|uniref:Uncharacterized protein n=1 Tax=Phytophthora fragariae TaxID=53985 RepID=A0A6A3QS35_9STRA|nr:hypothetical protein PF003_g16169 [Phytophthora fragariae]KAE8926069.1 hypothetical protein PF009_g23735 [Phytophthora fragariae]KAE8982616.1 hypothetical protein PF011_g21541 [Phytophthora fragariae]KAE9080649.1 hypothetical protein PF007_g22966 [Phytophthora fragariae]KAE9080688.1 hypothetical protein PF010_g22286 [Phytophthora fragariae]